MAGGEVQTCRERGAPVAVVVIFTAGHRPGLHPAGPRQSQGKAGLARAGSAVEQNMHGLSAPAPQKIQGMAGIRLRNAEVLNRQTFPFQRMVKEGVLLRLPGLPEDKYRIADPEAPVVGSIQNAELLKFLHDNVQPGMGNAHHVGKEPAPAEVKHPEAVFKIVFHRGKMLKDEDELTDALLSGEIKNNNVVVTVQNDKLKFQMGK